MADLSVQVPLPITALASSSQLTLVASGSSLIVHSGSTTSLIPPAPSASSSKDQLPPLVRNMAISSSEEYIATVSDDKLLRVYSLSSGSYTLLSTRPTSKKCSDLSFAPSSPGEEPSIIFSDKVGDVYLYPLTPRQISGERPAPLALQSDPTLNPDADLLLGHVSVLTSSVLTPCGKYIITSDRDEHIRVSRFPKSYIIERYLFGTDGFISALHIPASSPNTLISAGGEQWMRIWDWTTGELQRKVDIYPAVLPHRRARSAPRRIKRKRNAPKEVEQAPSTDAGAGVDEADQAEGSFYSAPEGYTLPGGQGVCVKKIRTVQVAEETHVVFFSEGAAAIHFFPLPSASTSEPAVTSLPLDFPVLDFTFLPSSTSSTSAQILISLDTTWGILKQNATADAQSSLLQPPSITSECHAKMEAPLVVAELSSPGLNLVPDHPLISNLQSELVSAPASEVAKLQLYPLLPLLPRWAGMEEDDELAGPSGAADNADAATAGGDENVKEKKTYTKEDLSKMGNKKLGKLRAQGLDVEEYMKKRPRGLRGNAKKQKIQAGAREEVEEDEQDDVEAQMNEA